MTDMEVQSLCGWAGPQVVAQEFPRFAAGLTSFAIQGPVRDWHGGRRMFYECIRKVLGHDNDVASRQEIGDCVSWGSRNAMESLQSVQILLGNNEKYRPIFPPYIYGTSRVLVGRRQLGNQDGSTGVWAQQAVKQYGVVASDESGVPAYSGQIAKRWGWDGPPENLVTVGQQHLVKTTALISTVEQAAESILNGYPIIICSNVGFTMQPDSTGFHRRRGHWGHCLCLSGFQDHKEYGLYFLIQNSWGDVHGHLKDFDTGAQLPFSTLRVHADDVTAILSERDSFSFSSFDGFPGQADKLDKALFDVVGNLA